MNLAIATGPYKSAYSETFIKAQVDLLPSALRLFGSPVPFETDPGGILYTPKSPSYYTSNSVQKLLYFLRNKTLQPLATFELKKRLRKHKITHLLANYGVTGAALLPVCTELGVKLFVHFHGFDAHQQSVLDRYREAYKLLGQYSSGIIVVSKAMKSSLLSIGIPCEKIHMVRYGADPDLFGSKRSEEKNPIFLSVGRFVDKKAPYLTLLSFYHALRSIPDAKLIMVGDGDLMEATRNLATALGIINAVEFKGVLRPSEIAELMSTSSVFVQHSLSPLYGPSAGDSEGTPVAIIEAQMSSLPVISTFHAGIQEIIEDGGTGFLVNERDTELMAQRMILLGKDSALRRQMGDKAREKAVNEFTIERYMASLSKVLPEG